MRCMFTKLRHEQQKHQTVKRNKVYRDCRDSCKGKKDMAENFSYESFSA